MEDGIMTLDKEVCERNVFYVSMKTGNSKRYLQSKHNMHENRKIETLLVPTK